MLQRQKATSGQRERKRERESERERERERERLLEANAFNLFVITIRTASL